MVLWKWIHEISKYIGHNEYGSMDHINRTKTDKISREILKLNSTTESSRTKRNHT